MVYGYRRVTALLREAGWAVNRKRVERIWRRGAGYPAEATQRAGYGATTAPASGCGRRTRTTSGPTTSSRIVPTTDGSTCMLNVIDEFTRECLAIRVDRT